MNEKSPKGVISISSHVMRGAVGNRAIAYALTALGHNVWDVPTVVLPWHPGHGPSTRLVFDENEFGKALADLAGSPKAGEIGAAITGYFASAEQVKAAAALIKALKSDNPDLVYLCDPVIGDRAGLYVSENIATAIRDLLLPMASIATPNRFELAWLASSATESNQDILEAVGKLGLPEAVVTSAHAMMTGSIANCHFGAGKAVLAEHRELPRVPNGLGDLLSSLFLAHRLASVRTEDAVETAVAAVFDAALQAVHSGCDELMLEAVAPFLRAPRSKVQMRQLLPLTRRVAKATEV